MLNMDFNNGRPFTKGEATLEWERNNEREANAQSLIWLLENKQAILQLHSSIVATKIFTHKWCNLDFTNNDKELDLSIGHHIHCNSSGKKSCGDSRWTLAPSAKVTVQEARVSDITAPEVMFPVKKGKMSQRQRKAAAAAEAVRIAEGE